MIGKVRFSLVEIRINHKAGISQLSSSANDSSDILIWASIRYTLVPYTMNQFNKDYELA
jgi:hypothetical protein